MCRDTRSSCLRGLRRISEIRQARAPSLKETDAHDSSNPANKVSRRTRASNGTAAQKTAGALYFPNFSFVRLMSPPASMMSRMNGGKGWA